MKIRVYYNGNQHYLRNPEEAYIEIKSGFIWEHNGIEINDILKANKSYDNKTNCSLYEYTRLEFDFFKLKKPEIKRLKFKSNCFIIGKANYKDVPMIYVKLNWFQRNKIYWQLKRTPFHNAKIPTLIITAIIALFFAVIKPVLFPFASSKFSSSDKTIQKIETVVEKDTSINNKEVKNISITKARKDNMIIKTSSNKQK